MLKEIEKIEEINGVRTRWVARTDDGNEYICVICDCCGQPWPKQTVIRFSQSDFQTWQAILSVKNAYKKRFYKLTMPLRTLMESAIIGGLGYLAYLGFQSPVAGALTGIAIFIAYCAHLWKKTTKREKSFNAQQQQILASYGNIPVESVGMVEDHWKKYVILPRK